MTSPTVESSGTQVATGAEDTVYSPTAPRDYVFVVDLNALTVGDTVRLRCYRKVLSGGTERVVYEEVFSGSQATPIAISEPMPGPYGGHFTIEQVAGTLRSFPWSVESV